MSSVHPSPTPFLDAIAHLSGLDTRFFVPGHKGNAAAIPFLAGALRYDLTEIPGADDLSHPSGPLAESERNMTALYGSGRTLYSACGSSACIEAMFTLFTQPNDTIIIKRGCHIAAVRALCFTGCAPVWVQPENGTLAPAALTPALQAHPGAPVYITSPDYYGNMDDIASLAAVCAQYGSPLLVDNAHGAYLRFLRQDLHPITLGADAACDSAHKTLPCLTPAALLHLKRDDDVFALRARQALNLFSSTSPSYLVLASLDHAAGLLGGHLAEPPPDFDAAAFRLRCAVDSANAWPLVEQKPDPLRLCLFPAQAGLSAGDVCTALQTAGIFPEYSDGQRIVLMASPYNTQKDFDCLAAVLAKFSKHSSATIDFDVGLSNCAARTPKPSALPKQQLPPRAAYFSGKERVRIENSIGRIAASIDAPCPPGVPLVIPGEILDSTTAALCAKGGISMIDVVK